MKQILSRLNNYFSSVPDQLRQLRWLVWILFIGATAFFIIGISKVTFDMTMESWFSDDDPVKQALMDFRREFGSDDGVFIVYRAKDGDIFSEQSLRAVQEIREEILSFRMRLKEGETSWLEHVTKVDTITSASVLNVEGDSLISKKFIGHNIPTDAESRERLRKQALQEKNFPLLYFSKDFQYGGIFINTDFGAIPVEESLPEDSEDALLDDTESDADFEEEEEISMDVDSSMEEIEVRFRPTEVVEYVGLMDALDEILLKDKYANHLEYFPVGNAPIMKIFMELLTEMGPLYIGMLVVMIALLWGLFRSFSAVLWPILIVILSAVWSIGFLGWIGETVTNMVTLTVLLILAVGTAYSVHVLSAYLLFRKKGQDHRAALRSAYGKTGLPCLLTAITTMVGMLAISISPINHLIVFGYSSAVGVILAFVFTVYLLPLMLDIWSPMAKTATPNPNTSGRLQNVLSRVLPLVQKSPGFFIALFVTIFLVCLYGATQVKIDSNMVEATKEGHILRKIYQVVDDHMMGTQNMEIYIDMGLEDAFKDPEVLKVVESIQEEIKQEYPKYVVRTNSLVDIVKDAYQVLNEDRPEMYAIPENPQVLAQTLFLFNNANPEDRRKLVSDDYSKSHISVQLHNAGSYEYTSFFEGTQQKINTLLLPLQKRYPDVSMSVTGGLSLMMRLLDYISWAQARSLGLAIGIISLILIFMFGSIRVGFLSIIPNLLPATLTFGLLGLFKIPLDSDTLVIAPVIIGIAVDDTIHFITHYRGEVIQSGDVVDALRKTILEVGQAITFTTLVLGAGFFIMAFSSFMSLVKSGIFGSLAIFVALFCDLFLLPALILVFKPKFQKKTKSAIFQRAG